MVNYKYITHGRYPFFEIAAKYIKPENIVLDVGAGNGLFAEYLKRTDIYLLDNNKQTCDELKLKYSNVFKSNVTTLPFDDGSLDVIHASHVVEHLYPPQVYKFMLEVKRCLKEGGYLIISAPLLWKGFYDDLSHIKPYTERIFINYMTLKDKQNSTRENIGGFEVIECVYRYLNHDNINLEGDGSLIKTGYTLVLRKLHSEKSNV